MKKLKKIFPLLLSVMVLMFGSLTVCAAKNIGIYEPTETDSIKLQELLDYAESKGIDTKNKNYIFYVPNGTPLLYICDTITGITTNKDNPTCVQITFDNGYFVSLNLTMQNTSLIVHPSDFCTNFSYSNSEFNLVANKTGFFPIPPVGKLAEQVPGVVKTQIQIIVPIVVGCLALLLGLTLSTRLLRKFLN